MDSKVVLGMLLVSTMISAHYNDSAANQLLIFKENTKGPIAIMTTGSGAPVNYESIATLNKPLIFHEFFMESMTHFVREKIPNRVVHAKGAGAFGHFEVTHDITTICKAKLFSRVGKMTPIAVRFSPIAQDQGGTDTSRDTRGFAIKFYTEDGTFDLVGLNLPTFTIKDPIFFPFLARIFKRNPATNLVDPNMLWDFITLHPESLHAIILLFSDYGIPNGYRFMPGFSIHTYQIVNKKGESYFVRFHWMPQGGIKTLRSDVAQKLGATDPDYATRDLYNAIGRGDYPCWTLSIQAISPKDVKRAGFDIFDVTKVLPLDKYPLKPVGKLTLIKNPVNFFAEIEQLAFWPSNLVPGILGAPDKVFEARRLAYRDAQNYRLGPNFFNIPVNCPLQNKAYTFNRNGGPPVKENMRDYPNYYPNSFNGPVPYKDFHSVDLIEIYQDPPNNLDQARDLYLQGMTSDERKRLIDNILVSLRQTAKFLQDRAVKLFELIHPSLSDRIRFGLQANQSIYHDFI